MVVKGGGIGCSSSFRFHTPILLLGTVAHASRTDEDGVSDLDRLYTIINVISKLRDIQGCLALESSYCNAISVLSPGTF